MQITLEKWKAKTILISMMHLTVIKHHSKIWEHR